MKKKYSVTTKDKEDWIAFTKQTKNVYDKDPDFIRQNIKINKIRKLDLHGFSLNEANKIVKKFIIESSEDGYKKLLVITGKGLKSKVHKNPYLSKQASILKYSVPEFIQNDVDLFNKINKISQASIKDGGERAFYIFLRNKKNLQNKF